jgi:hypothetical protein
MKYFLLLFIIGLSCTPKPAENKPEDELSAAKQITAKAYADSLQRLPFTPSSSLHALEIFRDQVDKQYPSENDKAFQQYLNYQVKLIDSLYNQLVKRPDYEAIESLIWADQSQHQPEGLQYEKELNQNGLHVLLQSPVTRNTRILRSV